MKPVSRLALANMCCGLIGVQIVWGLQNVNTSRIFQTLGANLADLPILWIAGPMTGLLVQPVIGHLSDRTWTRMGRRRPYLLVGALLSAAALVLMPRVHTLWGASLMLWLLTGSINVAMEPFRALVADGVPERQRSTAFALQVVFIGSGAVLASALPWMLSHWFGVASGAPTGEVPAPVRVAYDIGAVGLLVSVGMTVFTTRERPPGMLASAETAPERAAWATDSARVLARNGMLWLLSGGVVGAATLIEALRRELYLIAGVCVLFGLGQIATAWSARKGLRPTGLLEIVDDVVHMPDVLRRLAVVQFFTWFGLFAMWIYAVPAIAGDLAPGSGPGGAGYNRIADWVGVLFACFNGVAALAAFALPLLTVRVGWRETHAVCLAIGAAGLLAFGLAREAIWLWAGAFAIGCAWASILSAPYAMVASAVPAGRMGVYMGIHNVFLVLPQLVGAAGLGWIVEQVFANHANYALLLAAGSFVIASLVALTIPDTGARASA